MCARASEAISLELAPHTALAALRRRAAAMRRLAPLLLLATAAAARTTRAAKTGEQHDGLTLGLAIAGLATAIVALLVALTALGLAIVALCVHRGAGRKPAAHGAADALSSSEAEPGRVGSGAHKRD